MIRQGSICIHTWAQLGIVSLRIRTCFGVLRQGRKLLFARCGNDGGGFSFVELGPVGVGVGAETGEFGPRNVFNGIKGLRPNVSRFLMSVFGWAVLLGVFPINAVVCSVGVGLWGLPAFGWINRF